jgi:glutathione S-transferase
VVSLFLARFEKHLLIVELLFGAHYTHHMRWCFLYRYLQINPSNKVPAIQNTLDGTIVYESAICNEYLSDYARQIDDTTVTESISTSTTMLTRQQDDADSNSRASASCWKLMPISASDRATLRLLQHHVDTVLNPAVFTLLMNKDPEKEAGMKETLENALEILQQNHLMTRGRGGPYLMGRDFSLADIHVLPFILRMMIAMKHYKDYDVLSSTPPSSPSSSSSSSSSLPSTGSRFQPLLDWYQLCSKRPSVQAVSKTKEQIVQVYDMFMDMDYAFGGLNRNKA